MSSIANAIAVVILAIAFAILRSKLRKIEILIGESNRTGGAPSTMNRRNTHP
ncbi:hypothetical protein NIES37_29040 [Tolypothrix tenuis PCC 7101]|uniref:Uncharacterized protein n=1 Tax=Tolypothrix tenuis PCC 7101 TaxID=231146 RepID=A0A1Z4MZK8_9CYAN|nr:hypothetical protein [Aulosira sp. FACHB-113]BAY98926.1 hypothetical protein NIES37_29040 [Tolypothrix tenuis PCC 7101]BAZ77155.1 hypothetical protein NIES50_57580 [Aulosira laxa NIES-50]